MLNHSPFRIITLNRWEKLCDAHRYTNWHTDITTHSMISNGFKLSGFIEVPFSSFWLRHFPRFVRYRWAFARIVVEIPIHQTCHKTKEKFCGWKSIGASHAYGHVCECECECKGEWMTTIPDRQLRRCNEWCILCHFPHYQSIDLVWDVCFSTDMVAAIEQKTKQTKRWRKWRK